MREDHIRKRGQITHSSRCVRLGIDRGQNTAFTVCKTEFYFHLKFSKNKL